MMLESLCVCVAGVTYEFRVWFESVTYKNLFHFKLKKIVILPAYIAIENFSIKWYVAPIGWTENVLSYQQSLFLENNLHQLIMDRKLGRKI